MRILLVEDEKKLANSLKISLQTESYAVDVCMDGESAYENASVNEYDLIILDIGLPKMDGITLCKTLHNDKINTPIIMLTARDTTDDKIKGLDCGADDYIVKPFNFEELLARIRAILRRGQSQPETVFSLDNLSLDPASRVVKRDGKELELTAKEYALLEYLIRHKGKIVSKSQIIEHVWDSETDPFSNVVDVYIGYLRNKIDKAYPKLNPLVYTIKGLGYRLGKDTI